MNKYDKLNEKIKEMYLSGKSSPQVAKELNIPSHSIVQRHLIKMNVKLRSIKDSTKLSYSAGRSSWAKGLTKESDDRLMKSSINMSIGGKGVKRIRTQEHNKKIGDANRRRIWRDETRIKMSLSKKGKRNPIHSKSIMGEKNPNWNGGKSFEPYSHDFNKLFKEAIRIRDNESCVICGSNKSLQVHHINYNKMISTKENCISLCSSCHVRTNFNRKYWQEFFMSMLIDRYRYVYINRELIQKEAGGMYNDGQ